MRLYQYQQITAPVGAFTQAAQQPSEWSPQTRVNPPTPFITQQRNRSRINNLITIPPTTAIGTLEWFPQTRATSPTPGILAYRNVRRISNIITIPPAAAPSTWEPRAIRVVRQPPRNTSTVSHLLELIAAPSQQPSEWHPHGLRSPPVLRWPNRSRIANAVTWWEGNFLPEWEPRTVRRVPVLRPIRALGGELVQLIATVPATSIDQWQVLERRYRHPVQPSNRSRVSNLITVPVADTSPTSIDRWQPSVTRQVRLSIPNRPLTAELLQLIPTIPPTSIDQWQVLERRFRRPAPLANRARISNLITVPPVVDTATSIDQWQFLEARRVPRGFHNRAKIVNAVTWWEGNFLPEWEPKAVRRVSSVQRNRSTSGELIQLIAVSPPTSIDQWQVLERRYRRSVTPTNRSRVSNLITIPSVDTSPTSIDRWQGSETRHPSQPRVTRDYTAQHLETIAAAQTVDEWLPSERRMLAAWLRRPNRSASAETIQLIIYPPTSIDQWNPYPPTQYRVRPPRREAVPFTVLGADLPTSIDRWQPSETRYVPRFFPRRREPAQYFLTGLEPTSIDQWEPRAIRRVPRAWAVHPEPSQTIQLIVYPPTSIREWETRWARYVPRIYRPRRDGYLWALPFVEPPGYMPAVDHITVPSVGLVHGITVPTAILVKGQTMIAHALVVGITTPIVALTHGITVDEAPLVTGILTPEE